MWEILLGSTHKQNNDDTTHTITTTTTTTTSIYHTEKTYPLAP